MENIIKVLASENMIFREIVKRLDPYNPALQVTVSDYVHRNEPVDCTPIVPGLGDLVLSFDSGLFTISRGGKVIYSTLNQVEAANHYNIIIWRFLHWSYTEYYARRRVSGELVAPLGDKLVEYEKQKKTLT